MNKINKYIGLAIFAIIAFFAFNNYASAQCVETGQNCTPWSDGMSFYTFPDYPNCPLQINYKYMDCDGIRYYQLGAIAFEECPACSSFKEWLLPNGLGSYPDSYNFFRVWKAALDYIVRQDAAYRHSQDPTQYQCPATFIYKTITGGGCNSVRVAKRQSAITHPIPLYWAVTVPCEENGCCVITKEVCWNSGILTVFSTLTQYSSLDCELLQPLYNPFLGFGYDWEIGPPSPCDPSCFIE
jgi:hypothetical protein